MDDKKGPGMITIERYVNGRPTEVQLLTMRGLERTMPFNRFTLMRMIKDGEFPEPIVLGRRHFWRLDVIEQWQDAHLGTAELSA